MTTDQIAAEAWTGDKVRGLLPHENPCWIEDDGSRTYLSDKDLEPIANAHNTEIKAAIEKAYELGRDDARWINVQLE